MPVRTFLAIYAVLAASHGLGFILMPTAMLDFYQVPSSPGAVFMTQLVGTELFFVALVCWSSVKVSDDVAVRAIVLAGLVSAAIGVAIVVKAIADGIVGPMGWLGLSIHMFLFLGNLYYWLRPAGRA